jgi:hypothetical protein
VLLHPFQDDLAAGQAVVEAIGFAAELALLRPVAAEVVL